jgi:hypothetical protein
VDVDSEVPRERRAVNVWAWRVTVEEAVRQRIINLSTTAGTRVYMLKLPQQLSTWPAARVQLVVDPMGYHLRGGEGLSRARVQVDCYAPETPGGDPYATVATLATEINGDDAGSGLSGWTGTIDDVTVTGAFRFDRRPFYEPGEMRLVRIQMDFWVHYKT